MSLYKLTNESLENERYQQYSLKLHQNNLRKISEKSLKIKISQPVNILKPKNNNKTGKKYLEKELTKRNAKILEKLMSIAKKPPKSPIKSLSPLPGSLNTYNRKKEAKRIAEENKKIVDRILNKHSFMSSKSFKKEYEIQSKYLEILSKNSLFMKKRALSNPRTTKKESSPIRKHIEIDN